MERNIDGRRSRAGRLFRGANRAHVRPAAAARLSSILSAIFALGWGLALVRPPWPVATGLDESWRFAIAFAAARGLQFGRDIVFTYGPLGYVTTGAPDPALALPRVLWQTAASAYAAFGVWTLLAARTSRLQRLAFAVGATLLAAVMPLDYAVFAGTLALLLRLGRAPRFAPLVGALVGAAAAFGMLAKFTLGIDVIASASAAWLCDVLRGPRRRRRAALLNAALAATVGLAGLGAAFRFNPLAVAAYLRGEAEISAGYSAAMTAGGPRTQVATALIVGAGIAAVAGFAWQERRAAVTGVAVAALFFAWKHGFVRQDDHIFAYFATAAVLAPAVAIAVRAPVARLLGAGATALALAAFLSVAGGRVPVALLPQTALERAAYLTHPLAFERRALDETSVSLRADAVPPGLRARLAPYGVDVLPTEAVLTEANGLRWSPLPVFQSYSAYTPALDRLNRDALLDRGADRIMYDFVAPDGHYPFGDMPATTTSLLCRYRPAQSAPVPLGSWPYVVLARVRGAACAATPLGVIAAAAMNRPIPVPRNDAADTFVVASFAVHPTLAMRAATFLWRAPKISLRFRYDDGSVMERRTVGATLPDGVPISPAPVDPLEAARFLRGEPIRGVRDVTLIARPGLFALGAVTFTLERRVGPRMLPRRVRSRLRDSGDRREGHDHVVAAMRREYVERLMPAERPRTAPTDDSSLKARGLHGSASGGSRASSRYSLGRNDDRRPIDEKQQVIKTRRDGVFLVGQPGFEPGTSCLSSMRSNQLSYWP